MKFHCRHRISVVLLAILLSGVLAPCVLNAQSTPQSTPNQSSSSTAATTTTKKKSTVQAQTPPSPGMVWVNTDSGVYHKSGSRWYGKTKQGKWMTEQDAQKAGYKSGKD